MPAVDPVILQLRADVKQYQNELRATTTLVSNQLDRQERSILSLEATANSATTRIGNSFAAMGQRVTAFVGGFALGTVIRELASLADQAKSLDAQLKLATNGFGTFGQAQADVERIAGATRSSLDATTKLYGGFVRAARETGRTQDEAARATQTFAEALKIGGAGAAEAESATLQFNQALQSGTLRGDEFNSIMEASPRIARLLADALGVPIGQLRKMAEEGKITSDVLFRALTDRKFTAGIDAEFAQLPASFGEAMQAIENAAIKTFGEFDKGGQFSNALVSLLGTGTDTFEGLTEGARQAGSDMRAIFDGLGTLFDPVKNNATEVLDFIGVKIFSVRDQIASVLGSLDSLYNAYANADNFGTNIENAFIRGLNKAQRRAGGGPSGDVAERPLIALADNRAAFLRKNDISRARSREAASVDALSARFGGIQGLGRFVSDPTKYNLFGQSTARPPRVSAGGGGKKRARSSGSTRAKVKDVPDVAELMAAISADLEKISINAGSAMKTESERLDQSASHFESIFGKEGKDYDNPFAGADDYRKEADARVEANENAERIAQDLRERNVYQLAGLYESLFQEGTDGLWRNFKDQGLRTLALIAAQATIASFSKGGGGFGSLLGNVLGTGSKGIVAGDGNGSGGILAALSKATPFLFGRASGGYMAPNSVARVNEGRGGVELLRMGSQGGTVIPLGATAAQRQGRGTTIVNQTFTIDNRYGITTPELLDRVNQVARSEATRAGGAAFVASQRSAPGTLAQYDKLEG